MTLPARVQAIIDQEASIGRISPDLLLSEHQHPFIAIPRMRAMARCRANLKWCGKRPSLPQIGRWFGGKHHTTVLHAVRRVASIHAIAKAPLLFTAVGDDKVRTPTGRFVLGDPAIDHGRQFAQGERAVFRGAALAHPPSLNEGFDQEATGTAQRFEGQFVLRFAIPLPTVLGGEFIAALGAGAVWIDDAHIGDYAYCIGSCPERMCRPVRKRANGR